MFLPGAVGLAVLVLNRVGGVLGVAARVALARIRMLGLILFGALLIGVVYKRFIVGS